MPRTGRIIVALILLALATHSVADNAQSVRFQNLSREQGLSQSFVYKIVQDTEGFLWFGTQEGLNRFDGYDFRVFAHDPDDPTSISDESVRTMIVDRSGVLWIGTDAGGLSRYDRATESFSNYRHDPSDPASIGDDGIRVILEDSAGTLWIGTDGSGLDSFDRHTGRFEHFRHDPSDPESPIGNEVWCLAETSDGALWIATERGLSRLDIASGKFTHFTHDPGNPASISDNGVRYLHVDNDENLWIGTQNGLNRFDRESNSFERFFHDPDDVWSISANLVNTVYQDDDGILWIGTVEGLNAWHPEKRHFERYFHDPGNRYGLAHDTVMSLHQDRGGVLWIGTYDGLSKLIPATRSMLHYRRVAGDEHSLGNDMITSFAESPDGDIWVGTHGGGLNLLHRESGHFRQFRHVTADDTSISSDRIMALRVDSEGTLWAGTRDAGLNRFDAASGTFERYRHDPDDPQSISADGISYILEDSAGDLWIATFGGGINYFDRKTGRFEPLRSDPDDATTLGDDRALVLFESSDGSIWVGTYGGGLNRLDPATRRFTRFRAEPDRRNGLGGDEIFMIQEDPAGNLWIAVKSAGLHRWLRADREAGVASFQKFTELDGLPSSTIYAGAFDRNGRLWLASARGLSQFDTATLEFRNLDTSHGLQGEEFNLSAGLIASDGRLYFGGINGFNAFHPDELNGSRAPPKIVIKRIASLDTAVDLGETRSSGKPVEFGHDQNVISLEYVALDYAAPDKTRYMYRLEGVNPDWVDAGKQRQVTYTNLPAGDYTFRVRARNNDGVWSEQDAVVGLVVRPAPWKTWWAYLVYLVVLCTLAYAAFRAYGRWNQQQAKARYADQLSVIQSRLTEAQRIARIGNWDWNVLTNELWWSEETYRLFQTSPEDFGATYEAFLELVHPDDRDSVNRAVERALRDHVPYSIDHRIIGVDGKERVVHERGEVFCDAQGHPVRMAGTVHDITDRKMAEDDVRRRAEFQTLLADISSQLIQARPEDFDRQVPRVLERVGRGYGLDAASVHWTSEDKEYMRSDHRWSSIDSKHRKKPVRAKDVPWLAEQMQSGEPIVIDDVEQMPEAAARDQRVLRSRGTKSLLNIPLLVDDKLDGACVYSMVSRKRRWSMETVAELKLISENLALGVARARAVAEIEKLKDQLQEENLSLREEVRLAHGFTNIIGEDPGLQRCLQAVEKVAPTDVAVLLLGETGTGKELFARAIHELSTRRDGPMISVNCPALPANLIESELFGHEKGAFTGAAARRLGRFELAEGGTLFLDEIGELPLELQAKLLRVLQTGEFERLGGLNTRHTNVRLIAATNRNLPAMIERGEFRSDLYYRISSFPITLPALRERKGDIPLLAEHFVHKHAERLGKKIDAISANMIKELIAYAWPGNVRELESIIERALISSRGDGVLELPGPLKLITVMQQSKSAVTAESIANLSLIERSHIVSVLEQTNWKISGVDGAAAVLGMPSSTLRSKMKRLGISRQTH